MNFTLVCEDRQHLKAHSEYKNSEYKIRRRYSEKKMNQLKNDLELLCIEENAVLTVKFVTAKYRKLAKQKHPDRDGGITNDFQELQNAYRRVIKYLEEHDEDGTEIDDYEKDFFMKNNLMKECTSSFVIYIQDNLVNNWKKVFERHLVIHKEEKGRIILKTGVITIS